MGNILVSSVGFGDGLKAIEVILHDDAMLCNSKVFLWSAGAYSRGTGRKLIGTAGDLGKGFSITAAEHAGAESFSGVWFLEVECCDTNPRDCWSQINMLHNLDAFYLCLVEMALRVRIEGCRVIADNGCRDCGHSLPYASALLHALEKAIGMDYGLASARLSHALGEICRCCHPQKTAGGCADCP